MSLNVKAGLGLIFLAVVMGLCFSSLQERYVTGKRGFFWRCFSRASALGTAYSARHDPALLRRRLRGGPTAEKETVQKIIVLVISIDFVGLLVVPALDHRFGWSSVPLFCRLAGDLLVVVGFYITFLVFKENTSAAATVEVAPDQRVITTGPYTHLRHPQYAGALLYLGGMPLALGSWWALLVFAGTVPFLIWRLLDEEKLLAAELPGYTEYRRRVRSRLIPGIY